MTFTVRLRRAAELDVQEAQDWYEEQQAGLARDFNHEFTSVMGRLAETPLIYPVVYRECWYRGTASFRPGLALFSDLGLDVDPGSVPGWQRSHEVAK